MNFFSHSQSIISGLDARVIFQHPGIDFRRLGASIFRTRTILLLRRRAAGGAFFTF